MQDLESFTPMMIMLNYTKIMGRSKIVHAMDRQKRPIVLCRAVKIAVVEPQHNF